MIMLHAMGCGRAHFTISTPAAEETESRKWNSHFTPRLLSQSCRKGTSSPTSTSLHFTDPTQLSIPGISISNLNHPPPRRLHDTKHDILHDNTHHGRCSAYLCQHNPNPRTLMSRYGNHSCHLTHTEVLHQP